MDPVVKFLPSERTVSVPAGTSLLDAVRLAGLPIAMGCSGGGACGRCGLRVLTGPIDSPDDEPSRDTRLRRFLWWRWWW